MKLLLVTFYLKGDLSLRGLYDNQEKISSPQISFVLWMLKLLDCGIWEVRYSQHLDDLFLYFHSEPIHGFKGLCSSQCWDWAAAARDAKHSPYWRHFLKEVKKIECPVFIDPLLEVGPDPLWEITAWLWEFPWVKIPFFQEKLLNSVLMFFILNSVFLMPMQSCLSKLGPEGQDKQWIMHTNGEEWMKGQVNKNNRRDWLQNRWGWAVTNPPLVRIRW